MKLIVKIAVVVLVLLALQEVVMIHENATYAKGRVCFGTVRMLVVYPIVGVVMVSVHMFAFSVTVRESCRFAKSVKMVV